jgi:7-carboxy-7-deazaguanine synthase
MGADERLRVNEIFYSIQGESTRAGLPCTFVRLTGCHLRCTYCDTEYSFYEGDWLSLDAILERVHGHGCPTVEVTGGEPLLQPAVYPLLVRLADEFDTVLLETSGAVSIARVDPRVVRIIDVKTPSSGECDRNCWENIDLLTRRDEVKFVIGTRDDYDWARDVMRRHELSSRCPLLMSPVIGRCGVALPWADDAAGADDGLSVASGGGPELYRGHLDPTELARWILDDRLPVRLGVPLHKILWPHVQRGV